MADRSVGARDESHASEASEALMFCFDRKVLHRRRSGLFLFRPPYKLLCSWMTPEGIEIFHSRESVCVFVSEVSSQGKQTKESSSRSPKELLKFVRSGWKILEDV